MGIQFILIQITLFIARGAIEGMLGSYTQTQNKFDVIKLTKLAK